MGADSKSLVGEVAVTSRVKNMPSPVALTAPVLRIATFHPASLAAIVATFPALMALRESFPGVHISSYVRAPVLPLLRCFHAIDEAKARPGGGISAQAALMARLHGSEIDIALSFSQGANSMLLLWATGAKIRAGFVPSRLEAFLTHRVEKPGVFTATTAIELIREIGAAPRGHKAHEFLAIPPESLLKIDSVITEASIDTPFLLLAPTVVRRANSARAVRESYLVVWRQHVQQLTARWPVAVVAPRDFALEIEGTNYPVLNLSGNIDSLQLAALVTRCALVLGDDSGPISLGKFLQRPVVDLSDNKATAPVIQQVQHILGL